VTVTADSARPHSGPATTVTDHTAPPAEVLARLGTAVLRADVVIRAPEVDRPVLTGLFTGPGGAWVLSTTLGTSEPTTVTPAPRAAVTDHVRTLAAAALADRELDGPGGDER